MTRKIRVTVICLLFTLRIPGASLFTVSPENTIVYDGDDTQLNCTFEETLENKAWFHGTSRVTIGETIDGPTEHYGLDTAGNLYNLQVCNATSSLSGMYVCCSQKNKDTSSSANLYVIDPIGKTTNCSVFPNSTVKEGQNVVFRCAINIMEQVPGNLVWLKRGEEAYWEARKNITWNTTLEKYDNGAEFGCQLQHKTLPRSRWSTISCAEKIVMNVQYGPNVSVVTDIGSKIIEGAPMTANCCSNDANPQQIVEVNWKSPNGSLISENETLHLPSLTRHDSGKYTCYMSNVLYNGERGTGDASVYVDVQYMSSVSITVHPDRMIKEGDNVTFHCRAENGNPNPNRMTLSMDGKHIIQEEGPTLQHTIYGVNGSDSGIYKCVAFTTFHGGSQNPSFAEYYLNVYYAPKIFSVNATYTAAENDVVKVKCQAHGFPRPKLTWRKKTNGKFSRVIGNTVSTPDGNNITSTLSVVVFDSSYCRTYFCIAENGIPPKSSQSSEIIKGGIFFKEWTSLAIIGGFITIVFVQFVIAFSVVVQNKIATRTKMSMFKRKTLPSM